MIPLLAFGMPAAPEWVFIGILALILFGPKKIPEIARGLGKALGELQRAKEDFHREITGVPPLPKIESPSGMEAYQATVFPEPAACDINPHQDTLNAASPGHETLSPGATPSVATTGKTPEPEIPSTHSPTPGA